MNRARRSTLLGLAVVVAAGCGGGGGVPRLDDEALHVAQAFVHELVVEGDVKAASAYSVSDPGSLHEWLKMNGIDSVRKDGFILRHCTDREAEKTQFTEGCVAFELGSSRGSTAASLELPLVPHNGEWLVLGWDASSLSRRP